jgi:type IV secretion system protein VirD4
VLPPKYLDEHGRFLRLFVNLALLEASKGLKPRFPVLMVLDEFYALGRLQFMAKAAGLLAGYGVKLWPIVQNLSQIPELYPDNWETFLGNAGTVACRI